MPPDAQTGEVKKVVLAYSGGPDKRGGAYRPADRMLRCAARRF